MGTADEVLWPHASSPARTCWAAQSVERFVHMAWIILSRAAAFPGLEGPPPPQALGLAGYGKTT
ncbi:MAG: hypothetical protein ACRELW_16705 [Candidatus Rokuibacteriota bacterium]